MDSPRDPHPDRSVPDERPLSLIFIVVAILAVAGVPIYTSFDIARYENRIAEVLEPAQRRAADLALVQARQMLWFREYLLTADLDARVRYNGLLADEDSLREGVFDLLDEMSQVARRQALSLVDASVDWHLGHRAALESDTARLAFLPFADEDQSRYEAMLLASRTFREVINREMALGRQEVELRRRRQVGLTAALLILALGATVAVGVVGRRLRGSIREADVRRTEAVRARREIDAILEATGDGVLGIDPDGRVLILNALGARLIGYTDEEARGRSVHQLLHGAAPTGEGHPPEVCPLLQALRDEAPAERVDDVVWHRRGRPVPVRWAVRPMGARGAVITLTDMTEIRKAEQALREAVRAREETMAVVSHDLRNPIGSIAASAELLLEVPLDEERTRRQLKTIQRAAERSNRLIQDLLDVARIDAGVLSVRPVPCEPGGVIEEAVALVASRAADKGVAVDARVGDDVPTMLADRDRLLQVLGNLLGNALRHTGEGGHIHLTASREDEWVALAVADSGQGIAAEDRAHLFDRFWRRDRTDRSGAGLGLAIVKGIVEAHGGRVEVESEVGRGSTFTVLLPPAPDTEDPAAAGPVSPE